MTIDVHADGDGTIAQGQLEQLVALKNYLKTQPPIPVAGAPEPEDGEPASSQEPASSKTPVSSAKPVVNANVSSQEDVSSEIPTEIIVEEEIVSRSDQDAAPVVSGGTNFKTGWIIGLILLGLELCGLIVLVVLFILKQKKARPLASVSQV